MLIDIESNEFYDQKALQMLNFTQLDFLEIKSRNINPKVFFRVATENENQK